jgi:MFS family permease
VVRTIRHPHAPIEKALFASRPFTFATIAMFLFFVGFAIFLLNGTLFLQEEWHYSAVRAGLAIMPGPVTAAVFAVNAGRIARRFGRVWPAVAGTGCMAVAAVIWLASTTAHPSYVTAILPGMLVGGVSAGLTQAPLFAAAGTLPPDRATTGSAVLNMARQVGSAVGVAVVVVILGNGNQHTLAGYHHAWAAEAVAGALAALAAAGSGPRGRGGRGDRGAASR